MFARKPILGLATLLLVTGATAVAINYRGPAMEMSTAAKQFIDSLSAEQRAQAVISYEDPKRLDWHFIPKAERKGLQIKNMNEQQRKLAHALLASGLSHLGYDKAVTVMSLEEILRELEKARASGPIRDHERYYFTIFGQPGMSAKWGWSVEGHHLSLNFAVSDGQIATTTPTFYGANPATVMGDYGIGPKKGTRVLRKEEELAFELLKSLDDQQRKTALIAEKAPNDIRGPVGPQAPQASPQGVAAKAMNDEQRKTLRALITAYTDNMKAEVAAARWDAIERGGFENIHFAWAGADKPGVGHYYVVQGPSFLIEFVNTQPDSAGNPANHIHSVWRNMAGDFGNSVE
jgi:hypothetical protein